MKKARTNEKLASLLRAYVTPHGYTAAQAIHLGSSTEFISVHPESIKWRVSGKTYRERQKAFADKAEIVLTILNLAKVKFTRDGLSFIVHP